MLSETSAEVRRLSRLSCLRVWGSVLSPCGSCPLKVEGSGKVHQVPLGLAADALRLGSLRSAWALAQRKGKVDKDLYCAPTRSDN